MKKFLVHLLLLFIPALFKAQPYFNDGATWYYDMWPNDTDSYIKIEKTNEIWIAGKQCDELKFTEYNLSNNTPVYIYYHYTFKTGDSVMILRPQDQSFCILYDFSLQAGDLTACCLSSAAFELDSVSTVMLGSTQLRTQHTHVNLQSFITYEKIGNTGFFIPDMSSNMPSNPGFGLRCYYDNTGLYLHSGLSESCNDGDESHQHASISIGTSPFAITVISNSIIPGSEISVYDMRGRLVVRESAIQFYTCHVEMQMDARSIYFATIRNGDELVSEKFALINPW